MLELPQLLDLVASLTVSRLGAARVKALAPSPDPAKVAVRQRRLAQLRALLEESAPPQLGGLIDIRPLLARLAVEGGYLMPEELEVLADFLAAVGSAASFLAPAEERFDELFRLANRVSPLPHLIKDIRRILGPGGSVASSASPELARVRRDLSRTRDRLRSELVSFMGQSEVAGSFSDQVVTQRAGRFVVPVKADAKGRVTGIIHDTSGSGATNFVEPLSAVEGNNQLALLSRQEREEIERVLLEVSAALARDLPTLWENLDALTKLDSLLAQAEFCRRLNAVEPRLNPAGKVELAQVRHPLLAWRALKGRNRAVPIEVAMDPEIRALVISGANAGGKTATLKTVGLAALMAQCGLQIPAAGGSGLPVFKKVLAEIGDDQDLDRELSTFTAHAGRLAWMVENAGRGDLALIDEMGNGTDPGEGSALGQAVLDWLGGRGVMTICTTHFHLLKAYAARTPWARNVSVSFDGKTGEPTYRLHYGTPGFSDALAVSRRLGFPPELVERAEQMLDQGEKQTLALLREAEEARQRALEAERQARRELMSAREKREEAQALRREAAQERAGALAEGKRRVRDVARRMEERLEAILKRVEEEKEAGRDIKPGRVKQELFAERRQAVDEVERTAAPPAAAAEPARPGPDDGKLVLRSGSAVKVTSLEQSGVLLEDPRPGSDTVAVSVGVGGVRVMVRVADLTALPPAEKAKERRERTSRAVTVQAAASDGLDLKLLGMRVDDALPLVDKALDQAALAGKREISLVHGIGTGRLKAGVRAFLEGHPLVATVRQAPLSRGGAGVTVVGLRE